MINFKSEIVNCMSKVVDIPKEELELYIEKPKNSEMGDYAFPCFKLAKVLKKSPMAIAEELSQKIELNTDIIEKVEVVSGYLNFFINTEKLAKEVVNEMLSNENFGKSKIGEGKNVVIDYSHPNIAKPFHIGHLRSTVIGQALYNTYEYLGYNVKGLNYLGDYGTQFGKMIEGYKLWGSEYDIEKDPINQMMEIYVRINNLCKEDETVLENCRNNFKKLEDGDPYCVDLWKRFRELSLKEFHKIYDMLGGRFDSWDGEAAIAPKVPEIIDLLQKSGKLEVSEGAKIVSLEEKNMPPCMIEKSNGSSTYAARDLAAIIFRANEYNYDKSLYITSYEQILHFKQVFETAKYLGLDEKYINGLEHVPFGMVLLPTGKMSTREGTVVKLEELLSEAVERAREIIKQKNPDLENKEEVAKKVGIGAVIFNDLSNNRIKDEIFDWDVILNFQGETGPYIQYNYVRTKSIIEKAGGLNKNVKPELIKEKEAKNILKLAYEFEEVLKQVIDKNEPSILSRYLLDVAKAYSVFYDANKVIVDDEDVKNARIFVTYMAGEILKIGANLLGIEMPSKM